ncbi:hypothetical protein J6590_001429 [Homalodisca vitripennis]|nr:hypothetical protein J6590_001429 [Homalodisca vitripennis]
MCLGFANCLPSVSRAMQTASCRPCPPQDPPVPTRPSGLCGREPINSEATPHSFASLCPLIPLALPGRCPLIDCGYSLERSASPGYYFVDPETGTNTQRVEGMSDSAKWRNKVQRGNARYHLVTYLAE